VLTNSVNEINVLKICGTWGGDINKYKKLITLKPAKSVLKHIREKDNICQLLCENVDLIPVIAIDRFIAINSGYANKADIWKVSISNLVNSETNHTLFEWIDIAML